MGWLSEPPKSGKWATEEAGVDRGCTFAFHVAVRRSERILSGRSVLGSGFEGLPCGRLMVRGGSSWENHTVSLHFGEHKCGQEKQMSAFDCVL